MFFYYFGIHFFVYGFLGWCVEVIYASVIEKRFINRGFLNGPICPIYGVGVGLVTALLNRYQSNIFVLYLTSVIMVSVLEWLTGYILERVFHSKWWDYSQRPLNINGYVCLLFSLIWGVACVFIVKVFHPLLDKGIRHLPMTLGIVLLSVFGMAMLVDLYVTATEIFSVNRRLESMEKIASELHEISEIIGGNLFKGVVEAMEIQAGAKEKLARYEEKVDFKERFEKLKREYETLASKRTVIYKRLVYAFPKMRLKKYQNAWEELRKRWRIR